MTEKIRQTINKLVERFPSGESAVLPVLSMLQKEYGHISGDDMEELARLLNISYAKVFSTASFYSLLSLKPGGKYNIQVCNNIVCSLLDKTPLIEYISKKLGIDVGGTTPDGMFSLSAVQCLAACGNAPVIQINMNHYECITTTRFDEIIEFIKRNEGQLSP